MHYLLARIKMDNLMVWSAHGPSNKCREVVNGRRIVCAHEKVLVFSGVDEDRGRDNRSHVVDVRERSRLSPIAVDCNWLMAHDLIDCTLVNYG